MNPKKKATARGSGRFAPGELTLSDLAEGEMRALATRPVLVVGDLILDHYLWGSVERTTPEAPVPIVRHERDSWTLGAAANVAHNIAALGGRAHIVGIVGRDAEGERMKERLREIGVATGAIATVAGRPTTLKTRVVSAGQQLLRIDHEATGPLDDAVELKLATHIERLAGRCRAILLSDYLKGVLGPKVIAAAVAAARLHDIPLLVDPKGRDYSRYQGADLLTPNQREVALATGRTIANEADLERAGRALIRKCGLGALVATMDAEGLAVLRPRRPMLRLAGRAPEVSDVTGAGDTTIAALALGLAAGLTLDDAAALANQAGGIVVGKLGVATVGPQELAAALAGRVAAYKVRTIDELQILLASQQTKGRKVVFTNGCFDLLHAGHIQFLHEARRLGDILVVGLNTDRSVRAIKGPRRPILPQHERAAILSALEVVDYVVFFDDLTPEPLLRGLHPDVLVKGRNIPENEVVGREIVSAYGGRVCRLPILHGSTVGDLVDSIVGKFDRKGA